MTDICLCSATTIVEEKTFGQNSSVGTSGNYAREDHTHGTPLNPVISKTSSDQTINRALDTVYQNTDVSGRGMLVFVSIRMNNVPAATTKVAKAEVDSANPPTSIVASTAVALGTQLNVDNIHELTFYVPPSQYYRINTTGTGTGPIQQWWELLF